MIKQIGSIIAAFLLLFLIILMFMPANTYEVMPATITTEDHISINIFEPTGNQNIELLGGSKTIAASQTITAASPYNFNTGSSKIRLEVLSGADTTGEVTINGAYRDRDTGVLIEGFADTLSFDGVGSYNMSSVWFVDSLVTGDVNIITNNMDASFLITQEAFWQHGQEDYNIQRLHMSIFTMDNAQPKDFNLSMVLLKGTGEMVTLINVDDENFAPSGLGRDLLYRLDVDCLANDCYINAATDGIIIKADQTNLEDIQTILTINSDTNI